MRERTRRVARGTAFAIALLGFGLLAQGLYIPAKAWVAQQLLHRAWKQTLAGAVSPRPWPWADASPLARLRWPDRDISQIVLSHASARGMAFGPGHLPPSARPGRPGHIVLTAHQDTHFRFLDQLTPGDRLELEHVGGVTRYRVTGRQVIDTRQAGLPYQPDLNLLSLVTCWPASLTGRTPYRLVVDLAPEGAAYAVDDHKRT
ncbi:MAG: class GN sortase [Pseudomonadota bacterium]